ncbi:pilus assembly protein [Comamonas composti]|uniref:pilus assembly protein n=1 Tax=Comamonas composti TaxID=408558 RepID=UPI00047DFF9A|nr:PilC/PilY family type IV pilus protein [Comamonas composti]
MHRTMPPRFRKNLLALAVGAALGPQMALALDLAQAPPGTTEPYVAPNVILSLDDSTSMNATMRSATGVDLGWRTNVLKNAVIDVFKDTNLLPDGKIRLAWQTMGNCTTVNRQAWAVPLDASSGTNKNVMRVLEGQHRANFLQYMGNYTACTNTPTHLMVRRAHDYMTAKLNVNGPWASVPGEKAKPYLGCRRNYHILLTDGGWNAQTQNTDPRNYDGARHVLPDGTVYDINSPQTRLYRDTESATTIADWAFYSWATQLQDPKNLEGLPQPSSAYRKAPSHETFTSKETGAKVELERYWNPRYDPATWPHLVTFTIGFSNDALPKNNYTSSGVRKSTITAPSSMLPYGFDGNLADYANGTYGWRAAGNDKGHDMWHSALNGRGEFYAVEKGEDLKKAFEQIIGTINPLTESDPTSTATSGSNITRSSVFKFTSAYEPQNAWKGLIKAETVGTNGEPVPAAAWGGKNTADKLDAMDLGKRLILTWSDVRSGDGYKGGVLFKWDSAETYLSTAQKAMLGLNPNAPGVTVATNGENRLNYLRGDTSLEDRSASTYSSSKPFRKRKSRQGDIINSVVWYAGAPVSNYALKGYATFATKDPARTSMIYVGGNDGMLHGFSAADGSEKIAYVPRGVIPSLHKLTDPQYDDMHQHFVDGSPMTGDVDLGTGVQAPDDPLYSSSYAPDWRTMLVGALGAGGKGYFVLDVTDPASFSKNSVRLDRTRGSSEAAPNCEQNGLTSTQKAACVKAVEEDRDIGHITAQPVLDEANPMRTTQITRMNNNRWAAVMGNGYNSTNQRPVLLIQYLDNNELLRIAATNDAPGQDLAADNGLSAPRLVDLNGDGRPDIAYAGDNLGNLWKFDLTDIDHSKWKVAFDGKPLFTATGPASLGSARSHAQPITVAPTVRANDRLMVVGTGTNTKTQSVGGMMVAFGTGRNVDLEDPNSVRVQTLYSVLDNTRYGLVKTSKGMRLAVKPGDSGCTAASTTACIPQSKPLGSGVVEAKLAEQKITEVDSGNFGTLGASSTANALKPATWKDFNGWYMDLPAIGERLLKPMEFYDGSNVLVVYSQVPAKGSKVDVDVESCESTSIDEERQYRTLVNIMDGQPPSIQIVDKNKDGFYNDADGGVSRAKVSKGSHTLITQQNRIIDLSTNPGKDQDNKELLARMPEQSLRPSWRQVQ